MFTRIHELVVPTRCNESTIHAMIPKMGFLNKTLETLFSRRHENPRKTLQIQITVNQCPFQVKTLRFSNQTFQAYAKAHHLIPV